MPVRARRRPPRLRPLAARATALGLAVLAPLAAGCASTADVGAGEPPRLTIRVGGVPRAADGTPRLDAAADLDVVATDADVLGIIRSRRSDGGPMLVLQLDADAAARVAAATAAIDPAAPPTAIVRWDGQVVSTPQVMTTMSDRLPLLGDPATLDAIAAHLAPGGGG